MCVNEFRGILNVEANEEAFGPTPSPRVIKWIHA